MYWYFTINFETTGALITDLFVVLRTVHFFAALLHTPSYGVSQAARRAVHRKPYFHAA